MNRTPALAVCHRSYINGKKNAFFCLDLEFLFEGRRDDSVVSPCFAKYFSQTLQSHRK